MLSFIFTILTLADPALTTPRQNIPNPVEQGVGDVNPLSQSQRVLPVDLFVPTRFEKVYKLQDVIRRGDGMQSSTANQSGFVRFSGGVAAVFPFSTYEPTARGNVATIPAGTIFHLDLRPATPGDVRFDASPTPSAYNAVPPKNGPAPRARSLAAPSSETATSSSAQSVPKPSVGAKRRDDAPRSLTPTPESAYQPATAPAAAPAPTPTAAGPRTERLTPWSEPALRERVLDGLIDALVASPTPSVNSAK